MVTIVHSSLPTASRAAQHQRNYQQFKVQRPLSRKGLLKSRVGKLARRLVVDMPFLTASHHPTKPLPPAQNPIRIDRDALVLENGPVQAVFVSLASTCAMYGIGSLTIYLGFDDTAVTVSSAFSGVATLVGWYKASKVLKHAGLHAPKTLFRHLMNDNSLDYVLQVCAEHPDAGTRLLEYLNSDEVLENYPTGTRTKTVNELIVTLNLLAEPHNAHFAQGLIDTQMLQFLIQNAMVGDWSEVLALSLYKNRTEVQDIIRAAAVRSQSDIQCVLRSCADLMIAYHHMIASSSVADSLTSVLREIEHKMKNLLLNRQINLQQYTGICERSIEWN